MFRSIFFLCAMFLYGAEQTLCLNMIVKNEAHIICRCLDSVKEIIDYWVIVDTGSTDDTQDIIRRHLKDIPGELHSREWKNWGATRSEAFDLARGKGDYILFMDADDILEFDAGFQMPELQADLFTMWRGTQWFSYLKPQIVRGDLPWKWVGVTHEYLSCDEPYIASHLDGIHYTSLDDGSTRRQGTEKFRKNVQLLEEGLEEDPSNSRYMFYLAESYRDSGEKGKALECYQKRVDMGGWDEEVFCAKMQIGHMLQGLHLPAPIAIEAYRDAFSFRPHRIEPIYYIAELYNRQENYEAAYGVLKMAQIIPRPERKDALFNEDWIENYGLLFQLSICAYYAGQYEEALDACNQLLEKKNLPEVWKELTVQNRTFPLAKLAEQTVSELSENGAANPVLPCDDAHMLGHK